MFNFGNWYKKWWGKIISIFLTIFLIFIVALGFYFYNLVKIAKKEITNEKFKLTGEKYQAENTDSYWLGSAKPKITIVEFGDFACTYCKNSFSKIREIGTKYKNDVKIIFRDFPLHDNSLELAMAGRCAGEQGLFWLMYDKLFQYQGVNTTEQLIELANQVGADIEKFKDCLEKQKYLSQIQQDFTAGEKFGITGTPTWFINGYKIEGDIPYNLFNQIIEGLLK